MRKEQEEYDPIALLRHFLDDFSDEIPKEIVHSDTVKSRKEKGETESKVRVVWWLKVLSCMENHVKENSDNQVRFSILENFHQLSLRVWGRNPTLHDQPRNLMVVEVTQDDVRQANVLIRQFLGIDT